MSNTSTSDAAAQTSDSVRRRVLVVEDNYFVAIEIEAALFDAGFDVVGLAVSAEEAVALARAEQPDLAIMDIRLVGRKDGVDLALELRRTSGLRCIFATAHRDAETLRRATTAAPLGWLSKPYQPRALVEAVRRAFSVLAES